MYCDGIHFKVYSIFSLSIIYYLSVESINNCSEILSLTLLVVTAAVDVIITLMTSSVFSRLTLLLLALPVANHRQSIYLITPVLPPNPVSPLASSPIAMTLVFGTNNNKAIQSTQKAHLFSTDHCNWLGSSH